METIRLKFNSNIKDKILELLSSFSSDELEIVQEQDFHYTMIVMVILLKRVPSFLLRTTLFQIIILNNIYLLDFRIISIVLKLTLVNSTPLTKYRFQTLVLQITEPSQTIILMQDFCIAIRDFMRVSMHLIFYLKSKIIIQVSSLVQF